MPVAVAEILILRRGELRYESVFAQLRADQALLDEMWQAAESELDEHDDKVWVIAVRAYDGRPVAWATFEPSDTPGIDIKLVNSYEVPSSWDDDWYLAVHEVRHLLTEAYTCETFVFDDPLQLFEWDGYVAFADDWSNEPGVPSHHWTGLRRAGR